jgi:tetratricopeptide (TPR) repeat protein
VKGKAIMRKQPRYSTGQRIANRFLVHQALMGGMGEVYLCLDEQKFTPVALKTFQGSSPDLANIFKQEVSNWVELEKHPNIVRCFSMEKYDNIPFMVLEWVAGEKGRGTDLRSWLQRGALDLPIALRFTIDIVRGLIHAGEKSPSIVHRDLKPDNVLVNQSRQAKITDFGLATVAQRAKLDIEVMDESDLGRSRYVGGIIGTPAYMPPEQWRGDGDIDFRADMYAVGCMLYELLTGKRPYDARTTSEMRIQHLEAPLPALDNDLPSQLKTVLNGCLAKRREERYARLDVLLAELIELYKAHSDEPLAEIRAEAFTVEDYRNRGLTFANLGQHKRAIADYNEAIRLDPNDARTYSNRGASYTDLGQHKRAIADHNEAIRLDPNDAKTYSNRGTSYSALELHDLAIADFDKAIGLDPSLAGVYSNRGNTYGALGQHKRAIADHNEAIRLDPNDIEAYYNRGTSYFTLGQHEQAISDFDKAIRLDPGYAKAYHNRGTSYFTLGQHEQAISDFDKAIRLDPKDANAYYNRGTSYSELGQHEQAISDFDKAIRLDPKDAGAYRNRGTSYFTLGQHEQAISDFDKAIRLDPDYAKAYHNRAINYASLGQNGKAIADYDEAIRLDPTLAPTWLGKGAALADSGRLEDALSCFERAAQLGHPAGALYAAEARQMLGQVPAQFQQNEMLQVIHQLMVLYHQLGEAGLRQVLIQNRIDAVQIDEIIFLIKLASGK